ncbi:MAG: site-specific integrase [Candidatus Omnitrophota bacterium]
MERVSNNDEAFKSLGISPLQKETERAEDFWILHQREKSYRIYTTVFWLLDNLRSWFLEIGSRENLPKNREVNMSLYKQRRSRYYYINISYGGKRIRVTSRCEGKREANKIKLLLLTQLMQQQIIPSSDQILQGVFPLPKPALPTFAEASKQYLEEMCKGKKIAWDREDRCHRDLIPFFGEYRIDQITPQLVLKWREQARQRTTRTGRQISPRSVNYNLGYLKRFFNYAIDIQGWLKENPASRIKPLPENNKRDRVLSEDEEERLLGACEHDWVKRVFIFGIETGLRVGEIASLRVGEFYLDYGIPHFKKTREKNKVQTEFPLVSERLAVVISQQMSVYRATDHFFADEKGNPVDIHKIRRQLITATAKTGIKGLVFQDLRRTFCSRLNWLGCNKMFIEYLMGHTVKGIESRYLVNNLEGLYEELNRVETKKVEREKKNSVIHLSYFKKTEGVPVSVNTAETVAGQCVSTTLPG